MTDPMPSPRTPPTNPTQRIQPPQQPGQPQQPAQPRTAVLVRANELITGDRQHAYGDAAESFGRIAAMWSAILGVKVGAVDVALCMAALKISRATTHDGADSFVDLAGYAALAAEMAGARP